MTINKAQGQKLDFVGLYLPDAVFCHGQLYVALSRAKRSTNIKVLLKQKNTEDSNSRSIVLCSQRILNGDMTVSDLLSLPLNFLGSVYQQTVERLVNMKSLFQLLE
ncbi:iron-sulfur clusters transporter ATM1, mitochondrial-like, partial [Olea europaea var. sylvestris]|uniref:iron-sulfur clusters transporter ATM1, mitochondrial-like n=1 Tax=Olea europaea var. sylvestris TaxID=158386 RepID=UPI000C1D43FB